MASGPWADRALGSLCMDEWRSAAEVREVTEHAERPDLPDAAFEWEHTPHDEYLTAQSMGRPKRGRPPMNGRERMDAKVILRVTVIERRAMMDAAGDEDLSAWARRVLMKAVGDGDTISENIVEALCEEMVRDGLLQRVDSEEHEQVEEAPRAPPPSAEPDRDPVEGHGQAAPPPASGPDGEPARQEDAVEEAERPARVDADDGAAERAARRSEAAL